MFGLQQLIFVQTTEWTQILLKVGFCILALFLFTRSCRVVAKVKNVANNQKKILDYVEYI